MYRNIVEVNTNHWKKEIENSFANKPTGVICKNGELAMTQNMKG
jgi:hypothetical protein